ncbi:MAG TPA: hypothetical protein VJW77_07720 [Terriglobia bacterium]|nr:hypothetical protein [Terriglobia bacterium]
MKVSGWVNIHEPRRAGIRFSNRIFTEPMPFALIQPPVSSGIYAILVPDASCRPRAFRAIYFGEAGNFSQRVHQNHECFNHWMAEACGSATLYVAFCPTPLLKAQQRRWVEHDLIARYRPACNIGNNQSPTFYQPLLTVAK